ncbi:fumarylacetoacetate hydrolase family protein [uncultured Microbacterium sp.]|uniref:fumarylacetoacetate hydrolase family protein n=1 Tax=uncultured Microbacterium sp. TaxID=191216 RepID=UPI0028D83C17|nr:fumarylacetoacetate hydrolase family protein [uncultured Microbacterium sp.]
MAAATPTFSVGSFAVSGVIFPGLVADERVYDLRGIVDAADTRDMFAEWDRHLDTIAAVIASGGLRERESWTMDELDVRPPVQPAGNLIAAGANYRTHIIQLSVAHGLGRSDATKEELAVEAAAEADARAAHGDPYVWIGLPSAMSGAFDEVRLPEVGAQADWELELGVVIRTAAYQVPLEDAMSHVAGYTICNDLTLRTLVPRPDIPMMGTDWFRSKNHPTFYPTGPVLVPARFVEDPTALRIQFSLNGEVKQDQTSDDMLFGIPELISYISSFVELRPGDMLITGSPAGNGSHWGRFLQDGDELEATITGLGTQRQTVRGPRGQTPPWYRHRALPGAAV